MKSSVLFYIFTFLVHLSVLGVSGDVSNESLAEAWGLTTQEEITEVEHSQDEHHHHHHHHHHHDHHHDH